MTTFAEPSSRTEIKTQEIKTSSPQANTFPTHSTLSSLLNTLDFKICFTFPDSLAARGGHVDPVWGQ